MAQISHQCDSDNPCYRQLLKRLFFLLAESGHAQVAVKGQYSNQPCFGVFSEQGNSYLRLRILDPRKRKNTLWPSGRIIDVGNNDWSTKHGARTCDALAKFNAARTLAERDKAFRMQDRETIEIL